MILAPFGVRAAAIRVMTDSGVVEGLLDGSQAVFLGIPFAAPPTGEFRWQSPRPIAKWQGVPISSDDRFRRCRGTARRQSGRVSRNPIRRTAHGGVPLAVATPHRQMARGSDLE